jgi:hypothetical protein
MSEPKDQKQVRRIGASVALLLMCLAVAACGKRPGAVDPPPDVTDDKFPLTYPDLSTDPKPESPSK